MVSKMFLKPKLPEGWLTLFLLFCLVEVTVASVIKADWVDGLNILTWVALIAIVWGLVFARLRAPGILLHATAIIAGLGVDLYLVASTLPEGSLDGRLLDIYNRLHDWMMAAVSGGIANDNLLFLLLLAAIVWLIGYMGTWMVFHSHNAWWVSCAAGTGLIMNLSYAPELRTYFFIFLICAILLIVRLNVYRQENDWRQAGIDYRPELGWGLLRSSFWISGLVVIAAWLTPSTMLASQPISNALSPMTRSWDDVQAQFSRLFGGLRPYGDQSPSGFGTTLAFKTSVKLGGEVVLEVSGVEPRALRGVVYERYTGEGWLAADRGEYPIAANSDHPSLAPDYKARQDITETITVVQPRGAIVFAPSTPKRISMPTKAAMEVLPSFSITLVPGEPFVPRRVRSAAAGPRPGGGSGLARDFAARANLAAAVDELRANVARHNLSFPSKDADVTVPLPTVNALSQELKSDFELTGLQMRGNQITSADLRPIDMDFSDPSLIRSPSMAQRGFTYTVVSSVSTADVESLRKAGDAYPDWIKRRYLQLPNTVTPRTRELALQLSSHKRNAYDVAMAIQTYLRQLKYSEVVDLPPSAQDGVDFFLFQAKAGYCDYFASAFAVLARSVGLPARVVSGYAPGDPDPAHGVTLVRDSHAHTWPEVYFPQYGWIDFEPTPSGPTIPTARPEAPATSNPSSVSLTASRSQTQEDYMAQEEMAMEAASSESSASGAVPSPAGAAPQWVTNALIALAGLAVLVFLSYLAFWQRAFLGLRPAEAIYGKMCRLGSWLGVKRAPHLTPSEYGALLVAILPGERTRIEQIVDAYVRHAFGRKHLGTAVELKLTEAWCQVRNKLLRTRFNRR